MKRIDVLRGLLGLHAAPRYLEIGVEGGVTFQQVVASRKVAVDPHFAFEVPSPRVTPTVAYHEVASDVFFGERIAPDERFDVIFIDGLHTSAQTLRDLLNAVEHLAPGGVIVIDDTMPNSHAASLPSQADAAMLRRHLPREADDPAWMGDVYRVAFFVEAFLQAFSFASVLETPGQMILWRQKRARVAHAERTIEWVGRADVLTLFQNLPDLNGLPYDRIVEAYRLGRGD